MYVLLNVMCACHPLSGAGVRRGGALLFALCVLGSRPASGQERPALRVGLEHRARFERLANDYRGTSAESPTGLSLRTLLAAGVGVRRAELALELEDSRAYASDGAPLNTTHVDALDLLQASLTLRAGGVLSPEDEVRLRIGRFTMNVGSRRLVARSVFRNTISAFTGVELVRSGARDAARAFAVVPVTRRPSAPAELAENRIRPDRENADALLWGAGYELGADPSDLRLEAWVIGLLERDGPGRPSSNRRLVTPDVRVLRSPAPGRLDFELEAMLQLGTSRATAEPSDAADLRHRAFAAHAAAGYSVPAPWSPRVALQYDYASGDRDPDDGRNGRFDPLFGARAFELGATGLYGALARTNIDSPGVRIEASPTPWLGLMGAYRLYWLASARDAWTTAGLRDPSGSSGSFVGRQIEAWARASLLPGRLRLDVGGARLARGGFARSVGGRGGPALYLYSQLTFTGATS